jgi:UDP-N-acetylglucosamine 2-epimerase (non-hydrolysing)
MPSPQQKKIICIVGTRPEAIKMAPVIKLLRSEKWADLLVVSTGQHREMVRDTLQMFNISIDQDLDVMQANQTLAGVSARVFDRLDPILEKVQPHLVLVQGDTTSVMVAALASFYRKIPVGHVEAGLRTFDINNPFPEELNRIVAGLVSTIHFAPTQLAHDNLISEGRLPSTIHITGNTVIDALLHVASQDVKCAYPKPGRKLVLITVHRRENFGEPLLRVCRTLKRLHDDLPGYEFVFPVHPNPQVQLPVRKELENLERLHLVAPMSYVDLVSTMKHSHFIITDSGGIQEEAPALGKPVLVLRSETERPEAVTAGVAKLVGTDEKRLTAECMLLATNEAAYQEMARGTSPYGDGNAAGRIVEIVAHFLGVLK